jgi:hypothetical protein
MTMSLVLSAFASSPVSLLANKASGFFFVECTLPHHQHKPKANVYHLISSHPGLPEPS